MAGARGGANESAGIHGGIPSNLDGGTSGQSGKGGSKSMKAHTDQCLCQPIVIHGSEGRFYIDGGYSKTSAPTKATSTHLRYHGHHVFTGISGPESV